MRVTCSQISVKIITSKIDRESKGHVKCSKVYDRIFTSEIEMESKIHELIYLLSIVFELEIP